MTKISEDVVTIKRLRVCCASLGSARAPLMRRQLLIALILTCVSAWPQDSRAQEAVSSTSGGTSGTSNASSSATSTTDLSAGTSSASSPQAVSNAPSAANSLQTAPGGSGVFSPTPVQLYLSVFGGYDDNVNTNLGPKRGSEFVGGNAILDYTFGDPRLQIALNGGAGGNLYFENVNGQDYDIDLKGAVGITYKSTPRLTIGGTALLAYLTEPDFENPGGLNSRNGNYFYTNDKLFASYAWSRRFSTKTSYLFDAYQYNNSAVALYSNHVTNTFGNEFRFQLAPTTLLIAEYRYGIVSYQHEGEVTIPATIFMPAERLQLDSMSQYVLGGVDHVFNPRFSGSIRGGAEFRSYDAGGDRTGPYFEGTLNYAVGKRTSVSWNARYGIEEPEVVGAQSRTTFRTGLHAKFDLTSRVSSTFDAYYAHDDYHSDSNSTVPIVPFTENSFDIGLGIHYAITPMFGVQAGYHYTDVTSDAGGREYSRNRVTGGVSLKF